MVETDNNGKIAVDTWSSTGLSVEGSQHFEPLHRFSLVLLRIHRLSKITVLILVTHI